jgi:hypothetical protein
MHPLGGAEHRTTSFPNRALFDLKAKLKTCKSRKRKNYTVSEKPLPTII